MKDTNDKQSTEIYVAKRLNDLVSEDEQDLFNRVYQIRSNSTEEYLTESVEDWNDFKQQYLTETGEIIGDSFLTYKNLNKITGWIVGAGIGFIIGALAANGNAEEIQTLQDNYVLNPDLVNFTYLASPTVILGGIVARMFEHTSPHFFTKKIRKRYQPKD